MGVEYKVYTDGSAKQNGKLGGWAYIIIYDDKIVTKKSGNAYGKITNNQMELTAVLQALKWIEQCGDREITYVICSDSAYIINCFKNKWYKTWQANNWHTVNNRPVKNQSLWKPLLYIALDPDINFVWTHVKGHAQDKWNNEVDAEAQAQALAVLDGLGYE